MEIGKLKIQKFTGNQGNWKMCQLSGHYKIGNSNWKQEFEVEVGNWQLEGNWQMEARRDEGSMTHATIASR